MWRGSYIEVAQGARGRLAWSWWRCCRCGEEIVHGYEIADGLHVHCRRGVSDREAERLRAKAREADREQYRRDHPR
jgi:hypothetical protein